MKQMKSSNIQASAPLHGKAVKVSDSSTKTPLKSERESETYSGKRRACGREIKKNTTTSICFNLICVQ